MSDADGLVSKFHLLSIIPLDRRVGRKHIAVFAFILDWHHRKYGDALASVRHIVRELKTRDPFGKGLYMGDVHTALTDLVSWGYLTQDKGTGRRASRYVPVWNVFDSVRESPNTTDQNSSVRESPNADVLESPNATSSSVRGSLNEDPSTETRLLDRVTGREIDCAEELAPGLKAGAAHAQVGFEELWRAYAYRSEKKAARSAYDALAPDADIQARMVEAAGAWQAAWAAQGRADAPRKKLHTWLLCEDWDCEPPTAFKPKERKPKPLPQQRIPATVEMTGEVNQFSPFGTFHAEIFEATITKLDYHTERLSLRMTLGSGSDTYHRFIVRSPELNENARGQAMWKAIAAAAGRPDCTLEDVDDVTYRPLVVTIDMDTDKDGKNRIFIRYEPAAANDNLEAAA